MTSSCAHLWLTRFAHVEYTQTSNSEQQIKREKLKQVPTYGTIFNPWHSSKTPVWLMGYQLMLPWVRCVWHVNIYILPQFSISMALSIHSATVYPKKYAHGFVVLCFVVVMEFTWIHMKYLSIFIRVALLALGQSLDCHSASEVSLIDMGKSVNV